MNEKIEVFENDITMYLHLFCEEQGIDDLKKESQSVWNGCMRFIRKHVFNDKKLKATELIKNDAIPTGKSNYNAYDYGLVNGICDIYIDLCCCYDKEISQMGFHNLTGIHLDTLNQWRNEQVTLSPITTEIWKKLNCFREESLSNKLTSGKNPVGTLAILNHHYQWNMPGVREADTHKQILNADELPRFNLSDNSSVPKSTEQISSDALPSFEVD